MRLHVASLRGARWLAAVLLMVGGCGAPLVGSPGNTPGRASASGLAAVPGTTARDADPLDAWAASLMARGRIPGLAVVVVRNGTIVRSGHYGLANVELNVPVNEETSFRIASMSKAFTAAALMLLVEDGRLALDDRVTSHLDGLPASWHDITLRQLLNNTSGMSNDWDLNPGWGTDPENWTVNTSDYFLRNTTDDAFLQALADVPLLFPPGERFNYAAGTFVVGRVIEKVSGMPYAEFMRARIFEPLGMTHTMVNDAERVVPQRASGYRVQGGVLMRGYRLSPAADARGDVGVLTTALDLAKWDAAMRDTRLLSRSSLDEIATPARLNDGSAVEYGLGWGLWLTRGYSTMSHD
jgi:D-alanyl-D-alanine carboxypeptidase